MHGVAYDEVNDEISIPVALGGAILVFRGGASGQEAPIRTIQGPETRLMRPQTIAVDPVHDEIIVGDTTARAIFVFDRTASGGVKPKRALYGDKTHLLDVGGRRRGSGAQSDRRGHPVRVYRGPGDVQPD